MDLKSYITGKSGPDRDDFAKRCGTSRGVLQNIMYGFRTCNPELAVVIDRVSDGAVRRWDLRPEDWHRIWPELIGKDGAPRVTEPVAKAA
jgi:DNA-binding transcriptional regulator YdaS (Cro superfamily)